MTVQRTRRNQPVPPEWDDWDQPAFSVEEQSPRGASAYVTAVLVLLAVMVVCGAGFLLVRLLLPHAPTLVPTAGPWTPLPTMVGPAPGQTAATPMSGQAQLSISPTEGGALTLVNVSGEGWWPGEAVFISLRSPEENVGHGFAYAAAVSDEAGRIRTAFTFPNEQRWVGQPWAEVIARGSRSNLEAKMRFTLVMPTATNTVPVPTLAPYTPPAEWPTATDTATPRHTDTPVPTATPTQLVITDWRGDYYANMSLTGQPVLTRNDVDINFVWGPAAPAANLPADGFSVRWTRSRQFKEATYRFSATVDDGVRVFVDDRPIIDEWHETGSTTYSADVHLAKGTHTLRVEYYENVGAALIQFGWVRLDSATATPTVPVPTATPTGVTITDWRGEYYANPSLAGSPTVVRNDYYVDFTDWGLGAPADGLPVDHFSVRWTRDRNFRDANYIFKAAADDGVKVFVDDQIIIDEWHGASGDTYSATVHMTEGTHTLRIEYYDEVAYAFIQFSFERVR